MSTRMTIVLSVILIVAALALSLAVLERLPDRFASHWNAADQVDGTTSRLWGAFLMPLLGAAMLGLFLLIPAIDPLKANIAAFRGIFNAFILLLVAFLLYMHVLTILWNLGWQGFRMSRALLPALGLLFIFIGVLLRRARRNFFIGIRTPWTLSSDRVWRSTHSVGSVLYIVSGLLALLGALSPGPFAFWLVLGPILASTLFLVVYSYVVWRAEQTGA